MVRERAVELAIINGRPAQDVSKSDWEQAKRELTGEPDTDPKEAILESAPESERWDPVPGSTGHKVPVAPVRMRMTRGEAIMKGSLKKASQARSMIKCSKPPEPNDKRRNDEDSIGARGNRFFSLLFHLAQIPPALILRLVARIATLLNSRSHSTELATAAQRSQSPKLKLTVENACCRNGM